MTYYESNHRRAYGRLEVPADLRAHMLRVYNYMAGGLAVTGLVAYAAATSGFYQSIASTPLIWVVMLASPAFVLVPSFGIERMSASTAAILFVIYAAAIGLSLGGIFFVFTGASIARVFFINAATYAAMSLYGYTTRSDLSQFGAFLFMGLMGVVIASLDNIFQRSDSILFVISIIGVIVFVSLTSYDTQRIKEMYLESDSKSQARRRS